MKERKEFAPTLGVSVSHVIIWIDSTCTVSTKLHSVAIQLATLVLQLMPCMHAAKFMAICNVD